MKQNKIPNGVHQAHVLSLNSGFLTEQEFLYFFEKSEKIAYNILKDVNFLEVKEEFFECTKKINEEIEKQLRSPAAPHGGSTIIEHIILSLLRNDTTCNILMHEPRVGMFLYKGEEILKNGNKNKFINYRGIFAFNFLEKVKEKIKIYEKKYNIICNIGIELEDFENYEPGKIFRENNKKIYNSFDFFIHSKHSLCIAGKNIPIDAGVEEFEKIFTYFSGNIEKIIVHYVKDQIVIIEKNGKAGDSLAHPDLIRLPLIQQHKISALEANSIISKLFQKKSIQMVYEELCDVLNQKKMYIGINLALGGKLQTTGLFYGQEIIHILREKKVSVLLEKDTHNMKEEARVQKYWNAIADQLQGCNIHSL